MEDINKEEDVFEDIDEDEEITEEFGLKKEYTIDESILKTQFDKERIRYEFNCCFHSYKSVNDNVTSMIRLLKNEIVRMYASKINAIIMNNGMKPYINATIDKTKSTKDSLKNERQLLLEIKKSLNKLYRYKSIYCLNSISYLLFLIDTINDLYIDDLKDTLKTYNYAVRGIGFESNEGIDEKISKIDKMINESCLKLGLYK